MNCLIIMLSVTSFVNKYAYKGWLEWIISAMAVMAFSIIVTVVSSVVFYKKDMIGVYHIAQRAFVKRRKR